jgi:hypothetical protein
MRTDLLFNRHLGPFVLGVVVLCSGCTSFELTGVRNDLARQLPEARISDGYAMAFGGVSLGFARWIAGFADDEDGALAQTALREVRRVHFGRYRVEGTVDGTRLVMPERLRHYVEDDGWAHLATFRTGEEAGWVLYRDHGDSVTDLFAVILTGEELVLARLSGDLSALVTGVMQQERSRLPIFRDAQTPQDVSEAQALVEAAEHLAD